MKIAARQNGPDGAAVQELDSNITLGDKKKADLMTKLEML